MNERALRAIVAGHGFSPDAVRVLVVAIERGNGTQAQFEHVELGGAGQWMPGMVQIADMSNVTLRARVASLCADLATLVADGPTTDARPRNMEENAMKQMESTKPAKAATKSIPAMKAMKPMAPMAPMPPMAAPQAWWPARLGSPNATGAQNGVRYAYFRARQRLVVDVEGYVATYDTGDRVITGIAQAQADDASHLVFTAQDGAVPLESLQAVSDEE